MLLKFISLFVSVSARFNKDKTRFWDLHAIFCGVPYNIWQQLKCKEGIRNTSNELLLSSFSSFHHYFAGYIKLYIVVAKTHPFTCKFKMKKKFYGCFSYAVKRTNICDYFNTDIFRKITLLSILIHIHLHRCNHIGVQ